MAGRKKLFRSAFIGATIFVFMVLCVHRNGSEPGYKGKPLSFWFREYCLAWPNASGAPEPITGAIRAMGSDAVPYLVRELLSTNQDFCAQSGIEGQGQRSTKTRHRGAEENRISSGKMTGHSFLVN